MINAITLLGSSSGRNAGDAALLSGIMSSIDSAVGSRLLYEIPTSRPSFILHNYPGCRVKPISMQPWHMSLRMLGLPTYNSIKRTDLTLVFDAILFDRALFNPLFNFLSSLYVLIPAAKRQGKKMGCFNVSAGPVSSKWGKKMLRCVCQAMDFITVRDLNSLRLLKEVGVDNPNIIVTADAALNVLPANEEQMRRLLAESGLDSKREILGINVSAYIDSWASTGRSPMGKQKFISVYSKALNRAAQQIGANLLFVCTQHHDIPLTKELMQAVETTLPKALITNRECNHHELKGLLGQVSLLFAMRLHAVILACSSFTPTIALPHQPKVVHFLDTLGLAEWALSFADFSEEALVTHILKGWEQRASIQETLRCTIPREQQKAASAAQLVAALHKGESLSQALKRLSTQEPQ